MCFKGNGPTVQRTSLSITLSHNKTEQDDTHGESRAPLSVFVASRAEQIAEQSAELSTAVVPCRTWRGPFSQHDSAVQNGAMLEPGPLNYKSRKQQKKKVPHVNIQCKITKRLATTQGRPAPTHSCRQSQHGECDEQQQWTNGLGGVRGGNGGTKQSHELLSGRGILNLCSKTNS